jgi:hypothetical protein
MSFNANGHRFEVSVDNMRPDSMSIYPAFIFTLKFSHKSVQSFKIIDLIFNFGINKQGWHYLGPLIFEEPFIALSEQISRFISARLTLDPYGLKKIEELRENDDIRFRIFCNAVILDQGPKRFTASSSFEGKIAKSDWVERFLPAFGYKEVILLEIPKLNFPEFKKITDHLNDAWKKLSMGEYNIVLNCCRKTIEEIGKIVREKGYETKDEEGDVIPDWSSFFGNDELGDIVGTINKKIYGFTWPGAHAGKSVNKEEADYALMVTHAIANLVIKRMLAIRN